MKKEVFLAIIIGFGIGLVITYGIYTAQTAIKSRTNNTQDSQDFDNTSQDKEGHAIHIISPEAETISPEANVTLSGITTPLSYIVILTTENEYVTKADESGSFAKEISLEAGANFINATSISPDGTKTSAQTIITYSTASLTKDKESTESAKPN